MSTEYIVLRDPAWMEIATVKANNSEQAIRLAGLGDGPTWAIPVRNLTIVEAEPEPPVEPRIRLVEQDTKAWLRTTTSLRDPRNRDDNPHPDAEIVPDSRKAPDAAARA